MVLLITGGAGYLGSILVHKLFQAKSRTFSVKSFANERDEDFDEFDNTQHFINFDKIIVYDNLMYKQTSLIEFCYRKDFEFVNGDVRDTEKLISYVKKADVIIPLAAIVGFPACENDKTLAYNVNQKQIEDIVKNMNPEQKIIYPNTNSGYGIGEKDSVCSETSPLNPVSYYGITKVAAEKAVLNFGGIALRLATVFGVSTRMRLDLLVNDFTYKAFTDKYIVLFEKDFKRNYIHIQDVAMTFMFMINNYDRCKNNTYNVGLSNANLSKDELCQKIKKFIPGFSIQYDNINSDPDKRDYIISNDKLENEGWRPYYTLEDGIQELIHAYNIILNSNRKFTNL